MSNNYSCVIYRRVNGSTLVETYRINIQMLLSLNFETQFENTKWITYNDTFSERVLLRSD